MEYQRKQAKALVRGFRAGEPDAIRRAEDVLGSRARERFLLSDAQHVVAREQGFESWRELKRADETRPRGAWVEGEDVRVPTGLRVRAGRPRVGRRAEAGLALRMSDGGRAVELVGAQPGWRGVAETVVDTYPAERQPERRRLRAVDRGAPRYDLDRPCRRVLGPPSTRSFSTAS